MGRLDEEWDTYRSAVFGAAYRILGTVTDAEDVVQDVWLRAAQADLDEVEDLRAWLVTVAARRSYDVATSARARRESYVGPWLPEPLLTGPDAAQQVMVDDTVTTAMLLVMERMSPAERVAFVLHQAFEVPYERIAEVLGRSAEAVRQLASRGARKVREAQITPRASREQRAKVLAAYRAARERGDLGELLKVLDPEIVYTTDGGGKVYAARKTVVGALRVAELLLRVGARAGDGFRPVEINGEEGLLLYRGGALAGVVTFEIADDRITRLHIVLNPEKFSGVLSR